jgi:hypothetical protein
MLPGKRMQPEKSYFTAKMSAFQPDNTSVKSSNHLTPSLMLTISNQTLLSSDSRNWEELRKYWMDKQKVAILYA